MSPANRTGFVDWRNLDCARVVACACCNPGVRACYRSAVAVCRYAANQALRFSSAPWRSDMTTLDTLLPGQRGRITNLVGNDSLAQRLMELGLFVGEEVEVLALAPLGDPLEVRLGDSRLSLRRAEASRIQVTLS